MELCTKVHPWGPTPETDNGAQPWGLPQGSDPSCSPSTVLLGAWLGAIRAQKVVGTLFNPSSNGDE